MAVLIDPPLWPAHGRRWSHLASDASLAELHTFAVRAGIPERGFEGDHYDVPEERYADTVAAGAMPVSSRELLRRLQGSGLRRPKRRGEKVLGSVRSPSDGVRVDALLSALPPIGPVSAVHAVVVAGRDLLVLPDDVGYRLPAHLLAPGAEDLLASARSLVVALVGGVAVPGTDGGSQVGYLRRVAGALGPDPGRPDRERGGRDGGDRDGGDAADEDAVAQGGTVVGEDRGDRRGVVGAVVDNEVVLRFVLSHDGRLRSAGGAVWAPAQQVVALLDGPLAALAAGAAYRPPERARGFPAPPAR
jgi:hypothetical protein